MKGYKKIFFLGTIILLLAGTIKIVSGFWLSGVNGANTDTENVINVGTAEQVETEINLTHSAPNQTLIPIGASNAYANLPNGYTESIILIYNVNWDAKLDVFDQLEWKGKLIVNATNIRFEGAANNQTNNDLINVLVDIPQSGTIILNSMAVVTITVTLNMPSSLAQAQAIQGGVILFGLVFEIIAD